MCSKKEKFIFFFFLKQFSHCLSHRATENHSTFTGWIYSLNCTYIPVLKIILCLSHISQITWFYCSSFSPTSCVCLSSFFAQFLCAFFPLRHLGSTQRMRTEKKLGWICSDWAAEWNWNEWNFHADVEEGRIGCRDEHTKFFVGKISILFTSFLICFAYARVLNDKSESHIFLLNFRITWFVRSRCEWN